MRLESLPSNYAEAREALHQIAFFALSPARHKTVGRMGADRDFGRVWDTGV